MAIERSVTDGELVQEARRWYHRTLPGGMPRDWIMSQDPSRKDLLAVAAMAAALSWAGRLHLTDEGGGTDYGVARLADCVLCQERRR